MSAGNQVAAQLLNRKLNRNPQNTMKKLLILSLALFLTSACGWHLRGTQPLPAELQILHLETPNQYSTLSKTLRRGLRAAGVTLTDDAKAAPFTLVVLGEDTNQRTLSTSERGKVSEYELTYQLRYAIKDQQGNTILGPDSITQRRSYVFDKNNVSSTY